MNKSINSALLLAALVSAPTISQASMVAIDYIRITNNNTIDVANQLSTEVRDQTSALNDYGISINANESLFTFSNNVGTASNISEIYFDDGVIFQQSSIINSIAGFTSFDDGGNNGINPGDLPGGNNFNPSFSATADFGADVLNGNPNKGIDDSNDILGIVIELLPGVDFNDLQNALFNGDLRLGLHVRSIDGGGSDSFINNPGPEPVGAIPVPAAVWLFGSAMLMLTGYNRKNKLI